MHVIGQCAMMGLWKRLMDFYDDRRRAIDLKILWPTCVRFADDLHQAKAAFALHAFNDPAWVSLGEEEIKRRIDALKPPAGVSHDKTKADK